LFRVWLPVGLVAAFAAQFSPFCAENPASSTVGSTAEASTKRAHFQACLSPLANDGRRDDLLEQVPGLYGIPQSCFIATVICLLKISARDDPTFFSIFFQVAGEFRGRRSRP